MLYKSACVNFIPALFILVVFFIYCICILAKAHSLDHEVLARVMPLLPIIACILVLFSLDWQFRHLRTLRTMPLSAGCLALILQTLPYVPLAIITAVEALVATSVLGKTATLLVLKVFLCLLSPMGLYIFVAVRLGSRVSAYVLTFVLLLTIPPGSMTLLQSSHLQSVSFVSLILTAMTALALFVFLTRYTILHDAMSIRSLPQKEQ
jgi:hypothetical protein